MDDKNEEDGVDAADIDGDADNGDLPGADLPAPKPTLSEAMPGQAAKAGRCYLQRLTGRHVYDSDAQPGSVGSRMVKRDKPLPKGQTAGETA